MKIDITINDAAYPCRNTMGAMLRFKKETGKEIDQINCLSDLCAYLYCCVASSCNADKVKFEYTFEDFADNVSEETLALWADTLKTKADGIISEGDAKKKVTASTSSKE